MKKCIILSAALFFMGCGNDSNDKSTPGTGTAKTVVKDPEAAKGLELITKSDCLTCHKLTEAAIGPSYASIANKYKVINESSMDSMVTQIIKGGKGRWGNIPMKDHPLISIADAQSIVHYIMSIKE